MQGYHKSSITDFLFLAVSLGVFVLAIAGDSRSFAALAKSLQGLF